MYDCDMFWSYSLAFGLLVCYVALCFVTFLYGFLGLVWYLIVLIPDLCLLSSFVIPIGVSRGVRFQCHPHTHGGFQ